jgi:beta-glucanase (GH16 family)
VDRVAYAVELLDSHGYPRSMTQAKTGTILREEFNMSIKNDQVAKVCQTRKSNVSRKTSSKYISSSRESSDEDLAGLHDLDSPPFNPFEVPPQQDEYY